MKRFAPFPALAALLAAAPAAAQIMPGLRAPATAHDAMSIGQLIGCTFAVTGRPTAVASADTSGAEGLAHHDSAPAAMLEATGMAADGTLAFTLDNPQGEVWLLNNPRQGRCAVATLAGDLAANEAAFATDLTGGRMGFREAQGGEAGTRRFESRDMGVTVTLKSPAAPGAPFAVITERRR
ncbi:MAG: hypothetical protein QOG13_2791 [Sphingomonadales bacterium]|jgi:hypothetical protein|nr:hypothetical protein [Sphingomonadales bacterium]